MVECGLTPAQIAIWLTDLQKATEKVTDPNKSSHPLAECRTCEDAIKEKAQACKDVRKKLTIALKNAGCPSIIKSTKKGRGGYNRRGCASGAPRNPEVPSGPRPRATAEFKEELRRGAFKTELKQQTAAREAARDACRTRKREEIVNINRGLLMDTRGPREKQDSKRRRNRSRRAR